MSLTDEEKAKPDQDPVLIRPGQSLTFAIGLHRDIAHPSSRV